MLLYTLKGYRNVTPFLYLNWQRPNWSSSSEFSAESLRVRFLLQPFLQLLWVTVKPVHGGNRRLDRRSDEYVVNSANRRSWEWIILDFPCYQSSAKVTDISFDNSPLKTSAPLRAPIPITAEQNVATHTTATEDIDHRNRLWTPFYCSKPHLSLQIVNL